MRFAPNARVMIADDLIATGGTAAATAELVSKLGGKVVECAFVIELSFLKGRDKLQPYGVYSMLQYDCRIARKRLLFTRFVSLTSPDIGRVKSS